MTTTFYHRADSDIRSISRTQMDCLRALDKVLASGGVVNFRDENNACHEVLDIDIEAGRMLVQYRREDRWRDVFDGREYVQVGKSSKVSALIMHGDPLVLGASVKIRFGK